MDQAESVLVALAQRGDEEAFTELVRRRQASTRQLMYRLCGDFALADDLAQQTFLKLWQNLRKLNDLNRFPGWLKRISINTWISHARKHDLLADSDDALSATTSFHDPTLVDDLERALGNLSANARACVVLAYLEGMTNEEIANALETPLGTVKSHIRRGSQTLREALADYASS